MVKVLCCTAGASLLLLGLPTARTQEIDAATSSPAASTSPSVGFFDRMEDGALVFIDSLVPDTAESADIVEGRKKRKKGKFGKYVLPLLIGFLMIKSILLPIALKGLAVLSGKALVLSVMSLILAAIVGLKKVAQTSHGHDYEVVNVPLSKYRRNDAQDAEEDAAAPYRYYRERRRKK